MPSARASGASAPGESARYWQHDAVPGVDLLRARYVTHRYARHAHETFTVGVIEAGVEEFAYGSDLLLAGPPTLDELAAAAGMSPFALLRAFRAETGLPPHAYLNQLRVRLARQLLDAGLPPAQVAADAGFADQPHLTRHFKRAVGVPPG